MAAFANLIGIFGVILVLIAYLLLQFEKVPAISFSFPFMNFLGSSLILFSLFFEWNLPAALIEGAWVVISLIGLVRWWLRRH